MEISIIVPVYNVEQYISRCLDSIVHQYKALTEDNKLEILLINDGSTDNSQAILDSYSQKYSFIKCFIKANGGVSDARNFGIAKASGDYIWFIDSDDWIGNNALNVLFEALLNKDLDVLEFDYSKSNDETNNVLHLDPYYSKIGTDVISGKKAIGLYGYNMFVWNRIFKRRFLNNINFYFPLDRTSEETIPVLNALLNADRYQKINDCLYFYYASREGSTTNIKTNQHLKKRNLDMLANICEMSAIINDQDGKIVSKVNEIQNTIAFSILISAISKVKSREHFYFILTQLKLLEIYPLKKHSYNNKIKWEAFRFFVNSRILTSLFFTLTKE